MIKVRTIYLTVPCLAAGLVILCLAAANLGAVGPAAECTVPGDRPTIQAAVDDPTCDIIDVAAGTFVENITVNRPVTIQGQGQGQTKVDGAAGNTVFSIGAAVNVTLTGMTIQNGSSPYGGGIYINMGRLNVIGATVGGNSASQGGGIYNGATVILKHCTLPGNTGGSGGAIYNIGTLTVSGSTLSGNTAIFGGAIHNWGGTVILGHSTLSGNSAQNGGGIYSWNSGTVTIANSTLSGNTADRGGGIENSPLDTLNLANTILGNNTGEGPDCWGTLTSQDYNLVEDVTGCTITGSTSHNITGQDPLLGPLQANGGPTWTQALLEGSPALDAGNCPGATADQRGFPRPVDIPDVPNAAAGCDIGAFEYPYPPRAYLPVVSLVP